MDFLSHNKIEFNSVLAQKPGFLSGDFWWKPLGRYKSNRKPCLLGCRNLMRSDGIPDDVPASLFPSSFYTWAAGFCGEMNSGSSQTCGIEVALSRCNSKVSQEFITTIPTVDLISGEILPGSKIRHDEGVSRVSERTSELLGKVSKFHPWTWYFIC